MRHSTRICEFNPDRDVQQVVSGLDVNITDMLQTGIVHDGTDDLDNNGIDDPLNIVGLVRDEFAAIDAQRAIRKYGKKQPAKAEAAAAAATAAAPDPSSEAKS